MRLPFHISPKRERQVLGFVIGLFITAVGFTALMWPGNDDLVSLGPMNTGHDDLQCQDCHTKARGNAFQQLQANVMHLFGQRKKPVTFGHEDVDSKKCQACHDRPNDRHPIHRFEEAKFAEVREKIHPENCESCHLEHNDVRLVITNTGYCENCHQETELSEDPLDVPHSELIENAMWTTCLQCHDFHGNHVMKTAVMMKDTIPMTRIIEYVEGGPSPYSEIKKYLATKVPKKNE